MRKLASIQKIKEIQPIPEADKIETATILGWTVVVKKNLYKTDDLVCYIEIDSLLPKIEEFDWLGEQNFNKEFDRYRIRTRKLKGQISQGLLIPYEEAKNIIVKYNYLGLSQEQLKKRLSEMLEGDNITALLDIIKWEESVKETDDGTSKQYEWKLSKTDEERIQANPEYTEIMKDKPYYITCKLDGTSSTYILEKDEETGEIEFNICGRNICYNQYNEDGTKNTGKFSQIAEMYDIERKLRDYYKENELLIALQGELIGQNIQSNKMRITGKDLYIFNVLFRDKNSLEYKKMGYPENKQLVEGLGMKFVPVVEEGDAFNYIQEELLEKAKGKYKEFFENADSNQAREGIVIRSKDNTISFKAINNDYLL